MDNQNSNSLHFIESLKLHSHIATPFQTQQASIYQSNEAPFDFYLSLELKGGKKLIEFYQLLANLHPAVIEIKAYQILPVSCTFFQRLLKTQQQVQSETMRVYMKYYNFRLNDWIQLKRNRGSKVEQEEIIYIIKILLNIAAEYRRIYNQNVHMFDPKNIFITNSWKVVIYPTLFPVKYEREYIIYTGRESQNSPNNHAKVYKQQSIGTYSSESTLQSSRVLQNKAQKPVDKDLIDIFLLILEILTFKPKEYFISFKHKMMKWDLVRQFLNDKAYVGHLEANLVKIFKEIAEGKLLSCQVVLQKLQQIIKQQQETHSLRKQNEKKPQEKNQKLQEQVRTELKKKFRKTICLSEIGIIKKCNSVQ